ncbi:extracellular solute-binding protein [Devosia sp. D6-9]|nr:extracellular solute-binding protein [Devosia sp. D6-9]
MKTLMKLAMVTTALMSFSSMVHAKETVVWWDFLGGGDGVRMKALLEEFNKEHADSIEIQATTLEWGTPFYTKAQTSAAVGEGPDVMTYHISRLPLGVSTNTLSEITADDLAGVGLKAEDYAPSNWQAAQVDGKQYAVPFDIHSIVLYYNKDKLKAAGLLGDDGLPKGLDGVDNFKAALQKLKDGGSQYGVSIHSAAGDSQWRIFYSLLNQQDGKFFADGKFLDGDNLDKAVKATQVVADWVKEGLAPSNTEYPASIALFTSGSAAMHINGVWEVPTFTDLAAKGQLGFEWGAVALPTFFDHPATWADSHSFVIPNNVGKTMTPEKRKAVMEVIAWMNKHSLAWAGAGHIPAYGPVRESAEFKALQPNATYSVLADTAAFDPVSILAGVASPVYDAAGNYMVPAVNGELDPQQAMEELRDDLQSQVE